MDNLTDILGSILRATMPTISSEALDALAEHWTAPRRLKRGDFLVREGQTEQHLYLVQTGTLRIFYPHESEEICAGFAYPHTLVCAFPSFVRQKPSLYYIQAIRACTLLGIARTDFYALLDKFSDLERCWRLITEDALLGKIERELEMMTFTPAQRYERLLQRSPHIFQLIPQRYIASYLRMTPETLSRTKAKRKS